LGGYGERENSTGGNRLGETPLIIAFHACNGQYEWLFISFWD